MNLNENFQIIWEKCLADGAPTLQCVPMVIKVIINWSIVLAGIVALFLIIYSGIKFITKGNKLEEELIKSMLNSKNSHFRFEKMNLNENLNILLEIPEIVGVGKNYYFYRMDIPIETYLFRNGKIFNDLVKSYENYSKISLDRAKFI